MLFCFKKKQHYGRDSFSCEFNLQLQVDVVANTASTVILQLRQVMSCDLKSETMFIDAVETFLLN